MSSRRTFLRAAGAAFGLPGAAPGAASPAANPLTRAAAAAEIGRRAKGFLGQRYMEVDYYRIRRRLAYPLPVSSLSIPPVKVETIREYPWATWMMWALEERVHALGWAAEWGLGGEYARAASRDLEALAGFPKYCQYAQPDLSSGHAGRLMWAATAKWKWPDGALRAKLAAACRRHVEEVLPLVEKYYGALESKRDLLSLKEPYRKLANIPLIGTAGAALTATAAGHPSAAALHRKVEAIFGAILDLRSGGHTEGVAYDGYILDFIADWLHALSAAARDGLLRHPNLGHFLDECWMLAAPGAIEEVAQLSDVEPREMPFYYSAQAKLERLQPDPLRAWYLPRWRPQRVRADALGALYAGIDRPRGKTPLAGALEAHYAAVLRTGWEPDDVAVAVSRTDSPMSHVQTDNGTLVIGTRGRWIVSDPGYQQYMQDVERVFTLGPAAHNYPHPGGIQQDRKKPRLVKLEGMPDGVWHAAMDLTACYPSKAGVRSVRRDVWLDGRRAVVVGDRVESGAATVNYHWHGHPEASWWADGGWILLHLPECDLWITSANASLSLANIERHAGSRGQLTLAAEVDGSAPMIWWVFLVNGSPSTVEASAGGRAVQVMGKRYTV